MNKCHFHFSKTLNLTTKQVLLVHLTRFQNLNIFYSNINCVDTDVYKYNVSTCKLFSGSSRPHMINKSDVFSGNDTELVLQPTPLIRYDSYNI